MITPRRSISPIVKSCTLGFRAENANWQSMSERRCYERLSERHSERRSFSRDRNKSAAQFLKRAPIPKIDEREGRTRFFLAFFFRLCL